MPLFKSNVIKHLNRNSTKGVYTTLNSRQTLMCLVLMYCNTHLISTSYLFVKFYHVNRCMTLRSLTFTFTFSFNGSFYNDLVNVEYHPDHLLHGGVPACELGLAVAYTDPWLTR